MITQHTRVQNMMFLMSLAPLSVGCVIVTDDGDTDANDDGGTANPTTTSGTPGTDGTDGGTAMPGTDGTDGGTAMPGTGDETAGPGTGDETAGDETAGTGGEPAEICVSYGDQVALCEMSKEYGAEATMYCDALLQDYYDLGGDACQMAFEDLLACLNALTCEEFVGEDPTCEAENAAIDKACPTR